MILDDIKDKLQELDPNIYYGAVSKSQRETAWNYTVFNRRTLKIREQRTGYSHIYDVHIVRENYIPEDKEFEYIDKMLEIDGMRLLGDDAQYQYIVKPNTDKVVEMLTLSFVKARKA